MRLEKNTIIGDLLDLDSGCQSIFLEMDMPCLGCPSSYGETLEEACAIHGADLGELLGKLRAHLGDKVC